MRFFYPVLRLIFTSYPHLDAPMFGVCAYEVLRSGRLLPRSKSPRLDNLKISGCRSATIGDFASPNPCRIFEKVRYSGELSLDAGAGATGVIDLVLGPKILKRFAFDMNQLCPRTQ